MAAQLKWEGKATAKLVKPTAEDVWPLLEDFFNFHKWLPSIDTCYKVEGDNGVVRHCSATLPDGGGGEPVVNWCHEKLIDMDPIGRWLSYDVVENNMGFKAYKSTLKVVAIDGGDGSGGCQIEWSFVADPVEGLGCADVCAYLDSNLQGLAKNLEKAFE